MEIRRGRSRDLEAQVIYLTGIYLRSILQTMSIDCDQVPPPSRYTRRGTLLIPVDIARRLQGTSVQETKSFRDRVEDWLDRPAQRRDLWIPLGLGLITGSIITERIMRAISNSRRNIDQP